MTIQHLILTSWLLFIAGITTCDGFTVHRPCTILRHNLHTLQRYPLSMAKSAEDEGFSGWRSAHAIPALGIFGKIKGAISTKWRRVIGKKQPGNLILIKSGEHSWNFNGTFTGWCDVDLTDRGQREMEYAGRLLLERGYVIDVSYTSKLKRAIRSIWIVLRELNQIYRPVFKTYLLNERMYGALEGMSIPGLAQQVGKDVVINYNKDLYARPPPMTADHPYWHGLESKYSDLDPKVLPMTESIEDCMKRSLPLWESRILPDLKKGLNVLLVAHGNSLRGIVKHIDNLDPVQTQAVGIPAGIPLVFKFDTDMMPVRHNRSEYPLSGEFLEKKDLLLNALAMEKELSSKIPGYDLFLNETSAGGNALPYSAPSDPRLTSLFRLDKERQLLEYCNGKECVANSSSIITATAGGEVTDSSEGFEMINPATLVNPNQKYLPGQMSSSLTSQIDSLSTVGRSGRISVAGHSDVYPRINTLGTSKNSLFEFTRNFAERFKLTEDKAKDKAQDAKGKGYLDDSTINSIEGPLLVIIRHGKTEHNKLGLFTGWEDAPLAMEGKKNPLNAPFQHILSSIYMSTPSPHDTPSPQSLSGRNEARDAGRLLRAHGLRFDIVYTSWLSRAIETAWLVLNELDALWLPLIKSWRLNERMYGALTGLSKKMIGQRHGDKQLKLWRRGYDTRPPRVSSFSHFYPGNDERYVKYVRDVRVSVGETLMRSLAEGRLQVHRAFPKTESLKDCMERTIPYFTNTIKPNSIDEGKNVLIASSENAIRGLLLHLCEIPPERIHEVEIPTGLPLVFDMKKKCVKLLDDGKGEDLLSKYNFGTSPDLLFRPCDVGTQASDEVSEEDLDGLLSTGLSCYIDGDGRLYAYDPIIRFPENIQVAKFKELSEGTREFVFPGEEGSQESALL